MANGKKTDHGMQNKKSAVPDPQNMEAKKKLNALADEINLIDDRGVLVCGARNSKKKSGFCRSYAGAGTPHKGYGRCKFCGGLNTGPKTAEGKEICSQNSTKHGLYSRALRGRAKEVYEELTETKAVSLESEIFLLKAHIVAYLEKNKAKWETIAQQEGEEAADKGTRVWYATGEHGEGVKGYYHAGTIEDKPLIRSLEALGRLVDKHAKLTQGNANDILSQVNAELRAASQGQVNISWGGKPQERLEKPID